MSLPQISDYHHLKISAYTAYTWYKEKIDKESAESGVAPARIKSHKFLFVLKKIYFAVLKKLMGQFVRKVDKVENLECLYQGDGILEKEWVTDSQCHSILQGKVSMYAKYVPIHQFFHKILGGNHFWA